MLYVCYCQVSIWNLWSTGLLIIFMLLAGWIGNDAISVVIGESDPYFNASGRVGSYCLQNCYWDHSSALLTSWVLLGIKSPTCCCRFDDICHDYCRPLFNSHYPAYPYGNICFEGEYYFRNNWQLSTWNFYSPKHVHVLHVQNACKPSLKFKSHMHLC